MASAWLSLAVISIIIAGEPSGERKERETPCQLSDEFDEHFHSSPLNRYPLDVQVCISRNASERRS